MRMKKKRKDKIYFTGLLTTSRETGQPSPPFNGAGWSVTYVKSSSKAAAMHNGREIVIRARTWSTAQRALSLILSSLVAYRGNPSPLEDDLVAHNEEEPPFFDPDIRRSVISASFYTNSIPIACEIAGKASRKRKWVYALAKYKFSIQLYGVFGVDLEPFSAPHLSVSVFPDEHVMFSHAIVSAYSVVEDLGLEIRASQKRPSRIGGKWNQSVKQDLEKRLMKAGIDLSEPILWTLRGPRRKTERKREIPVLSKTGWASGPVRDSEVEVVDAIAYSDWLRDCVASHAVKDFTKVLSPYDVVNVQHLARRLLLEVLGYWRYYEKPLVKER
jgi:hypothetical protein